jgi:hypothetical protein
MRIRSNGTGDKLGCCSELQWKEGGLRAEAAPFCNHGSSWEFEGRLKGRHGAMEGRLVCAVGASCNRLGE